jgi:hypothetical protein
MLPVVIYKPHENRRLTVTGAWFSQLLEREGEKLLGAYRSHVAGHTELRYGTGDPLMLSLPRRAAMTADGICISALKAGQPSGNQAGTRGPGPFPVYLAAALVR